MKRKHIILAGILTINLMGCGGGGGGSSIFDFFGLWLARFTRSVDTCNIGSASSGNLLIDISQSGAVIRAQASSSTWEGTVDGNGFLAADADFSPFLCPDSSHFGNITSTLAFDGASSNSVDSVTLSFFGDCPGFTQQCELTYSGTAIRVSGGNTSGDVTNSPSVPEPGDQLY